MYLLDTNVVSELRRGRRSDPAVHRWAMGLRPADLFVSAITIFEIELGTLLIERRDKLQGRMLRTWIDSQVLPSFDGRILDLDAAVAQRCARLHVPDPRAERDAWIAATALVHRMTVATRNESDFEPMGVDLVNPWR